MSPESAAEITAKEMVRGLIFSGLFKEVMSVSKEDLAKFVAATVFEEFVNDLGVSKKEFNGYLIKLANNDLSQSQPKHFKPFGIG